MTQVTIEGAQSRLKSVIETLQPGESIQITEGERPVATLVRARQIPAAPRKAGNCAGMINVISDDDAHLADFAESMPS